MDWSLFLECVLKAVGSIGASIIVTLAGILFTKLSSKIKDSKITQFIKEAVKAAEQLYPNQGVKRGTEKYEYVVKQTLAKFPSLTNNDYLKALIEGAVFALNKQLDQKKKEGKEKVTTSQEVVTKSNNTTLSSF